MSDEHDQRDDVRQLTMTREMTYVRCQMSITREMTSVKGLRTGRYISAEHERW